MWTGKFRASVGCWSESCKSASMFNWKNPMYRREKTSLIYCDINDVLISHHNSSVCFFSSPSVGLRTVCVSFSSCVLRLRVTVLVSFCNQSTLSLLNFLDSRALWSSACPHSYS